MNPLQAFDEKAMLAVLGYQRQPFLFLLRAITWTGMGYTWFALAILLNVLGRKGIELLPRQQDFLQAMVPSLATYLLGSLLKRLFARKRPPDAIAGYTPHGRNPSCGSFPSGHAAAAVALVTALFVLGHPLAWPAAAWALLVCFSRFYLGVHFPTDILGGAALGLACGLGVNLFRRLLTF